MTDTAKQDTFSPAAEDLEILDRLAEAHEKLIREIGKVVYGQREVLEFLLIGMLCRGHILLLGLPGLGKTLMASTLSRSLELEFRRIQFTPDLMPADITGTDIIDEDPETGRRFREFLPGPVFANLVLADEINRTPPKTQAALLQAMQEHQVSVGRETYDLQPPFMVVATENPIEMEGTYVLPEAQLDRFMFCVQVAYPTPAEEAEIVKGTTADLDPEIDSVMGREELLRLQHLIRGIPVSDAVVDYAVRLVGATRPGYSEDTPDSITQYASCGASPRASQYLILGAKARALLARRVHVDFDDVKAMAHAVLRHRLVLNFRARADRIDADAIVDEILAKVPFERS